jgi:pimeloyl-ACP methyl ester carboxylesterase
MFSLKSIGATTIRHLMLAIMSVATFGPADLKAATPSQVEGSLEEVACPFDSRKALLPVTCGRLKVPENYDKPGRVIEIAFMVVKARRNLDPKSPVLFLNGGPGDVSLHFAETLVTNPLIHNVVVDRDWVFFDQRGNGRSTPTLYCPDDENNHFNIRRCRDDLIKQGVDLSQYNSARSASDMEALRKALGVKQWNLWGISYGSRLAMTMARYYPSSVRSIVHDASGLPGGQELLDDARGTDIALNKIFSKCAADAACSAKFPELRSRFLAALPRLRQQPLLVGDKRFDDSTVVRFFRNWFYPRGYSTVEHRLQNLLIFMDAAARGDGQLMVDTQQRMRKEEGLDTVRPPVPIYGQQSLGQNLSVYCNEKKPFESKDDYEQGMASSEIVHALLTGYGDDCALWPSGRADPIENTRVYYDGPQLAFTGELDASSSGPAGYEIAKLYANARNVVFRNGIHGQFPTELPSSEDRDYWMCALRLGRQFFADPQRKLDTDCAETRQLRLIQ